MCFSHSCSLLLQVILLLRGAEVTTSCFHCFTTQADRANICKYAFLLGKMEAEDCLQRLQRGFKPLTNILIAFSEIESITNYLMTFEKEVKKNDTLYLPPAWADQFEKKIADLVKGVQDQVAIHPVTPCKPPCGFQKAARTLNCSTCLDEDCWLPVSCALENMDATEAETIFMPCRITFILPENVQVIWKYAKALRVTDMSDFVEIYRGNNLFLSFKPVRVSHIGTYACEIIDEDYDLILRRFYYLNVTQAKNSDRVAQFLSILGAKKPSQIAKEKRIKPSPSTTAAPKYTFLYSNISYAIYAAAIFMVITILVGCLGRYALSVDWETKSPRKHLPIQSQLGHMDTKPAS
ncbi:sperm acrosome membrane-associated protein 6 [Eleutherodactylus coqui]|uniref:sperm acrosome membrane-associated protein 6 n=1 Tax=Eleutherodactylus coqui TaxID=57060 RepID=UPI00346361E7